MWFDDINGVFYFLAFKEYDKYLSVENSKKDNMEIRFKKAIEPGILQIHDFHMRKSTDDTAKEICEIHVASVKDHDEFALDQCTYEDKGAEEENIKYYDYRYSTISAFSINWPYVAFSGLDNYLVLVNAFDRKILRRIQLAKKEERIVIQQTCITDSNDLFFIVEKNG